MTHEWGISTFSVSECAVLQANRPDVKSMPFQRLFPKLSGEMTSSSTDYSESDLKEFIMSNLRSLSRPLTLINLSDSSFSYSAGERTDAYEGA